MQTAYRARIMQPSTLQPLHHLDGVLCIAVEDADDPRVVDIHFTEGTVHSMRVQKICISRVKLSSAEN